MESSHNGRKQNEYIRSSIDVDVDVVFVVDCSESMRSVLPKVKELMLNFPAQCKLEFEIILKIVKSLRIRIIGLRGSDEKQAGLLNPQIQESAFFNFPEEREGFVSYVNNLEIAGKPNGIKSGMEALHRAIHSCWTESTDCVKKRQLIFLITNAPMYAPEKTEQRKSAQSVSDMPCSLQDMYLEWTDDSVINQKAKRLVMIAPNTYPWSDISMEWELVIMHVFDSEEWNEQFDMSECFFHRFYTGDV